MRPRLAAALLLPALALTACGGSDEQAASPARSASSADGGTGSDAGSVVTAALAATREGGTARVALDSDSTVGTTPFTITGEGLVDLTGKQSQLTLTLPFGKVEQRTVDGTAYVSVPQQPGVFYSVDAAALRGSALGGSSDPTSPLEALEGVGDVTEAGEEEVRGEPTTRYDGVVDVEQALAKAPEANRGLLESTLGASGLDEVPFSVWLDEDGRLRRFSQDLTLPAGEATGGQEVKTSTTLELFDYGVDVDVQAPPAAQVKDGSALLGQLPGAGAPGTTG